MFFVYILQSEEACRYYIGSTKNIQQRLFQHNAGMMKSTRGLRPWRLVHSETFDTLAQARGREAQIKAWKNPRYMERALGLLS
ncbi:MAG: GIY-YIG nuclease family protein [Chloroflexi bacterium]|nr:GIY-YIG nuclease family protein [Chloroflexota bacterium]